MKELRAKLSSPTVWMWHWELSRCCPWCGSKRIDEGEYVDVGVGGRGVKMSGDHCQRCDASEMGAHGSGDEEEQKCGWFRGDWPFPKPMDDDTFAAMGELARESAQALTAGVSLEVSVASITDRWLLVFELNVASGHGLTFHLDEGSDDNHVILTVKTEPPASVF